MPRAIFNSDLSNIGNPPAVTDRGTATFQNPVARDSALSTIVKAAGPLLSGVADIVDSDARATIASEVDSAVQEAGRVALQLGGEEQGGEGIPDASSPEVDTTRPDVSTLDINTAADRLSRLKQAGYQGRDVTDQFNLHLMATMKSLKTKYPNKIEAINATLQKKGLLDPTVQLLKEQGAVEDARRSATIAREEGAIKALFDAGGDVRNPDGTTNREATLEKFRIQQEAAAGIASSNARLGFNPDKGGGAGSFYPRKEFLDDFNSLKGRVSAMAAGALGTVINELKPLLNSPTGDNITKIQSAFNALPDRLAQFKQIIEEQTSNFNPAEKKLMREHLNTVMEGFLAPIGNFGEGAKDLNRSKAALAGLEIITNNYKTLNARDFPVLSRLGLLGTIGSAIVNVAGLDPQVFLSTKTALSQELSKFANPNTRDLNAVSTLIIPGHQTTNPDGSKNPAASLREVASGATENNYSKHERQYRTEFSVEALSAIARKGATVDSPESAMGFLSLSAPLNNYITGGREGRKPGSVDIRTMSQLFTHPSYLTNLKKSEELLIDPEGKQTTRLVGANAFDVVHSNVINLARELRDTSTGSFAGRDFKIVYDPATSRFEAKSLEPSVVAAPATEGVGRGRINLLRGEPRDARFGDRTEIKTRLDEINKAMPFLLEARRYNNNFSTQSSAEFIEGVSSLFPQDPKPFDPEGEGYDINRARDAGMKPAGTDAGPNEGHMGSVVEASKDEKKRYNLPDDSFVLLKGRNHETWDLAVQAEDARGFEIIKRGDRYFSVPKQHVDVPPQRPEPDGVLITPNPATELVRRQEVTKGKTFDDKIYKDSQGHQTIGVGHRLTKSEIASGKYKKGITEDEAEKLFAKDYDKALKAASKLPGFMKLDQVRQEVLANMSFNLGINGLKKFKKMLKNLRASDFQGAADEMADSDWAKQTGDRARTLIEMMRTGSR